MFNDTNKVRVPYLNASHFHLPVSFLRCYTQFSERETIIAEIVYRELFSRQMTVSWKLFHINDVFYIADSNKFDERQSYFNLFIWWKNSSQYELDANSTWFSKFWICDQNVKNNPKASDTIVYLALYLSTIIKYMFCFYQIIFVVFNESDCNSCISVCDLHNCCNVYWYIDRFLQLTETTRYVSHILDGKRTMWMDSRYMRSTI